MSFDTSKVTTNPAIVEQLYGSGYFHNLGDGRGYVPLDLFVADVPSVVLPAMANVTAEYRGSGTGRLSDTQPTDVPAGYTLTAIRRTRNDPSGTLGGNALGGGAGIWAADDDVLTTYRDFLSLVENYTYTFTSAPVYTSSIGVIELGPAKSVEAYIGLKGIRTQTISVTPATGGDTSTTYSGTATIYSDEAVTLNYVVIGTRRIGELHTDPSTGDFALYENISIPAGGTVTVPASSRLFAEANDYYAYVAWGINGVWSRDLNTVATFMVNAVTTEPTSPTSSTWRQAKDSRSEAPIRSYMLSVTGLRGARTGTHAGGTITSQTQCDAMSGKTVTGNVYFDPPSGVTLVCDDVEFFGGRVESDFNTSVILRHCLIDGNNQTYSASHIYYRGTWRLENTRIRRAQDAGKQGGGSNVTYRDVMVTEPSPVVGTLSGNATHQDGYQQMAGTADLERVFIDYEYNYSGGQGVIIKADSGAIISTRIVDSFIKAGGNNLTFERTANGEPASVDLGTGDLRNVFAPAANMKDVVSLYQYPPTGHYLTDAFMAMVQNQSFFVAEKNGATLNYVNGISKTDLEAVVALPSTETVINDRDSQITWTLDG